VPNVERVQVPTYFPTFGFENGVYTSITSICSNWGLSVSNFVFSIPTIFNNIGVATQNIQNSSQALSDASEHLPHIAAESSAILHTTSSILDNINSAAIIGGSGIGIGVGTGVVAGSQRYINNPSRLARVGAMNVGLSGAVTIAASVTSLFIESGSILVTNLSTLFETVQNLYHTPETSPISPSDSDLFDGNGTIDGSTNIQAPLPIDIESGELQNNNLEVFVLTPSPEAGNFSPSNPTK